MFATIIVFALAPWIAGLGLHNTFTNVGCLALALNLTTLPMIIWGKKVSWHFSSCVPGADGTIVPGYVCEQVRENGGETI